MNTVKTCIALGALMLLASVCGGNGLNGTKVVGPGVTWHQEFLQEGPLNFNVLRVELANPTVTVEAESGKDRLFAGEPVLSAAKREGQAAGTKIIAGVNADFWSNSPRMFSPAGLLVADGMIYNMPSRQRSAFVLTADENPYIGPVSLKVSLATESCNVKIDRINSGTRNSNDIVLFTPPYGSAVGPSAGKRYVLELADKTGTFLPNSPVQVNVQPIASDTTTPLTGRQLILHIPLAKAGSAKFDNGDNAVLSAVLPQVQGVVTSVVGGGPALVEGGKVNLALEREGIKTSFSETKHPRTALGYSKDKKTLFLVTVDGRQPRLSVGMSLDELARYMVKIGCWSAVNLDGGGSTTMVVNDKVVNRPSDFLGPRTVANSLLVVATAHAGAPATLSFDPSGNPLVVPAGSSLTLEVSALDENSLPVDIPATAELKVAPSDLVESATAKGKKLEIRFRSDPGQGSLNISAGSAGGSLPVKVVQLDQIVCEPEVLVLNQGEAQKLHVSAIAEGKPVSLRDEMIAISSAQPDMVNINAQEVTGRKKGKAELVVAVGSKRKPIPVFVDMAEPYKLAGFDLSTNLFPITGSGFNQKNTFIKPDANLKKEGTASARLTYQMEKGERTRISIPVKKSLSEEPASLALWVYGDGKEAWVRANIIDSTGALFLADFTNGADGITWKNEWKHLSVPYQSLISTDFNKAPRPKLPITIKELVIAQDQEALKVQGQICLDGFEALYPPE